MADNEMNTSENTQEVAEPDVNIEDTVAEETTVSENTQEVAEPERDREQEAIQAAARRRAESEYRQKLTARDAEYARRFGHLTNPATGKPIASEADYFQALDEQERQQRDQQLQKAGIDPSVIDRAIENNPAILEAKTVMQNARLAEGARMLEDQLREISKIDPTIRGLEDINAKDNFPIFDRLVRNGSDLVSAYKAAFFDELAAKKQSAGKQAAINSAKGKGHLVPTGGGAESEVTLSVEDLDAWKKFGFTAKDAQKYHKKFANK